MREIGIEIHFDEKRGYLEIACEPDEFTPYREIAREQLKDFPEIQFKKVIEMNIVDIATFVARRDAPKRRMGDLIIGLVVVAILSLALVGACAVITRILR